MVLESRAGSWRQSQMPHQVTYDVVATPLRQTNASAREIRYGAREYCWRPSQMPHQVTYDVVATPLRPTNASAVKRCFYTIIAN
eukprot:scaffold27254_cov79-Skeletonema_dohrnii-CCMP3373.AAC.1